ncbi:MFS transporter [Cetobacterium sp. SF1]|uniref:MFS transporter n=1 Tax=Cetobacterium sp. SF1 TaxID=3417654 RepID=UPI003CF00CE4
MKQFFNNYEKNKFLIICEGMNSNAMSLGIQGFALTALALYFNCTPFWISMISTLPLALQLLQVFLGTYYKCFPTKKSALLFSAFASRIPLCFLFFIVAFDIKDYRFLITIVFIYSFFSAFLSGIWTSSVGDIIKKDERSSFFSKRFILLSFSTVIFSFIVSKSLNIHPGKIGILILTAIITITAIITLILLCFHDIPNFEDNKVNFNLKLPLKDYNFVNFLIFIGAWNFTIEFTKPYFYYFAVTDLKAPYEILGISSSITATLSIIMFFLYEKIVKRIGNKKLLSFGIAVSTYVVVLYFLMNHSNVRSLIILDSFGTAIGWSAINLGLFSLLLDLSSPSRDSYTAIYSVTIGICGLSGALFGGFIGDLISKKIFIIFGDKYPGFQIMFFINLLLRFYCILLLTRVKAYQKNLYYPGIAPTLSYFFRSRR